MTKVEKVSIGKCAFTLEESAYTIALAYLDSLDKYYSPREGGHEIMEGIEERMAELILEKTGGANIVVSAKVINEIIDILGRPEVLEDDNQSKQYYGGTKYEGKKKIYRDPTNRVIGGVCSGLGNYFNIDPVILRVICVALFIIPVFSFINLSGTILIAYLIALIAIPNADTLQKQAEMKGKSLHISDIEKDYSDGTIKVKSNNSDSVFGRICLSIIGISLLMIGISGLIAGGVAAFGTSLAFSNHFFASEIIEHFNDRLDFGCFYDGSIPIAIKVLLIVFSSLVYFLPFVAMIYGGICLVFNLKSPSWKPGLVMFILWLVALVGLFVSASMFSWDAFSTNWHCFHWW